MQGQIPYSFEQGIFWGDQGQLEAQQGIKGYAEDPAAIIETNRRTRQTAPPRR